MAGGLGVRMTGTSLKEFTRIVEGVAFATVGRGAMTEALKAAAPVVVRKAKQITPVVGRWKNAKSKGSRSMGLKKSWDYKIIRLKKGRVVVAIIGPRRDKPYNVWYFHMVEEGHIHGKTRSQVPGKHYLRKAADSTAAEQGRLIVQTLTDFYDGLKV